MSEYLNSLHRSTGRRQGQTQGFFWGVIFGAAAVFIFMAACNIEHHHPGFSKLYLLGIGSDDAYDPYIVPSTVYSDSDACQKAGYKASERETVSEGKSWRCKVVMMINR